MKRLFNQRPHQRTSNAPPPRRFRYHDVLKLPFVRAGPRDQEPNHLLIGFFCCYQEESLGVIQSLFVFLMLPVRGCRSVMLNLEDGDQVLCGSVADGDEAAALAIVE